MKKSLSSIASAVQASTTLAIDALYKQMKKDGIDVVGFGAGEPDFDTPDNIKEAAIAAIHSNVTKYTPAAGLIPLREAVCARLLAETGVRYQPSQIVISSGAKHNLFIALMVLVNPGDEVILPAPYWVSYYEMIKMSGAPPVVVDAPESAEFKMTAEQLEAAITDKTKALMLNSPSNPTGMVYTKDELLAIGKVCVKHGIYIISDEIYCNLVYDGVEAVSVASLGEEIKDLTILINGVSKSYAMTGWRIGYAAANDEIAKVMANYQSHSTGAPSSVSQMAALEALSGPQEGIESMRQSFDERRRHICGRMNAIDGVSCITPHGAFYVMMNIEHFVGKKLYGVEIRNGDDFAKLFLEKGLVATVPCSGFGAPNYIRWSYAVSMQDIDRGLDRLETFIKNGQEC